VFWPIDLEQNDPGPDLCVALESLEEDREKFEPLRKLRLDAHGRVLKATRDLDESPWLCIGPADLRPAAVRMACDAARQAVSEQFLQAGNVWEQILERYQEGHWPCGVTASGELVVI
jgi:hypothetical protein